MNKQLNKPSLKKNAIFNIIYQIVQIGIPIILIPILSGRLKTDGNGNYAFIHSIVLYFSYFALLGVNLYGTRAIAKAKVNGDQSEKKTFWTIFAAKLLTSILAIAGYVIFALIYNNNHLVVYTQLFFLIANLLDVSWFFSGDENFKSLCIRNVSVKSLSLLFIVLFVQNQSDIGIYSLILGLAEVVNQMFMWALLIKKKVFAKENFKGINKKDIFNSLKGMAIFFIPQLLIELYTILNITILGAVHPYSEVGVYDYSNKIVSVLTTITVSLGLVFLARLSSLDEEHKKDEIKERIHQSLYYSLYISLPLVVGIIGTGHSFIQWFLTGDDWSKVGIILYFLPVKVLFVAISNTLGVQYLISTGKMKKYILSVGIGAFICILLNVILVKPLGAVGSAIAVVSAEFCVTLTQIIMVRKEVDVLGVLKSFWKPVVAAIVMGGYLAISYVFMYRSIMMFFAAITSSTTLIMVLTDFTIIIGAALLYFGVLILLKEKTIANHLLRKIKLKPSQDKYAGATLLSLVFALCMSVGFYKPYNIKYEVAFSIQRRAASASFNSSDNRLIVHSDDNTEKETPLSSIKPDVASSLLEEIHSEKTNGFVYHYNEGGEIDIITYRFFFFQCQDYGTTFKINLKYCVEKNDFILDNIDSMNICFNVKSFEHEDAPSVNLNINNSDSSLENYFANERRDFISYDGSTILWKDDDFRCERFDNKIYKDNYYCTVSVYFTDESPKIISSNLESANIRQEVWLLNG